MVDICQEPAILQYMKCFEYLYVSADGAESDAMLQSKLNLWGKDGWELVSVVRAGTDYNGRLVAFLKRPLPPVSKTLVDS